MKLLKIGIISVALLVVVCLATVYYVGVPKEKWHVPYDTSAWTVQEKRGFLSREIVRESQDRFGCSPSEMISDQYIFRDTQKDEYPLFIEGIKSSVEGSQKKIIVRSKTTMIAECYIPKSASFPEQTLIIRAENHDFGTSFLSYVRSGAHLDESEVSVWVSRLQRAEFK